MKKEIIILAVVISLVVIGMVGAKWFVSSGIKVIPGAVTSEYRDEGFGYSFVYPNTWTTKREAFPPGEVWVVSSVEKTYDLYFGYKDSQAIKSMSDLEAFVKDDAVYAETHQGVKTLKITPQQLGNLDGFAYDHQDNVGAVSRIYYVADLAPTAGQRIFVWIVAILNKSNSLDTALADQDVQSILASYKFLK